MINKTSTNLHSPKYLYNLFCLKEAVYFPVLRSMVIKMIQGTK